MSTTELRLSLLAPERKLLDRVSVKSVELTGSEGRIQILPAHVDMVGTLETGLFSVVYSDGKEEHGVISRGFFDVRAGVVTALAETVELASEIDLGRAKNAQKKAEEALREASLDEHQFRKYELKLQRAMIRQEIAGKSARSH